MERDIDRISGANQPGSILIKEPSGAVGGGSKFLKASGEEKADINCERERPD